MNQPSVDPRTHPPFWRHDWYTLHRLRQAIENTIQQYFHHLPDGPIVDVGAGSAPYKSLFSVVDKPYLCCDIDDNAQVKITPGEALPLEAKSSAAVVSFQVLEHVWDLDWYLGECLRVLNDNGYLLLSTHGVWPYHPHPTDFRRWTIDGLSKELEVRGFEIVSVTPLLGPLAWTLQVRALGYHDLLRRFGAPGHIVSTLICSILNARMVFEDAITPANVRKNNAAVYLMVAKPQKERVS